MTEWDGEGEGAGRRERRLAARSIWDAGAIDVNKCSQYPHTNKPGTTKGEGNLNLSNTYFVRALDALIKSV